MRVLILNNKKTNDYSSYFSSLLLEFLQERNYFPAIKTATNGTNQNGVSDENEILFKDVPDGSFLFFYSLYLRSFIRKKRIQWLVQFTDTIFFSTHLPLLVVVADSKRLVGKKSVSLSTKIIVISEAEKQKIITANPVFEKNICPVPASANNAFQPVSWSEKQVIKMQYTQGKEYFITEANDKTEEAFTSLLKAFSSFKKWQHSSMKLVVTGRLYFTQTNEWKEKLSSYKYRDDITIIEECQHQEHLTLLAGSYGFLHMPKSGNDVIPLLEAMQCETPCISFTSDTIQEYTNGAALLIEHNNYELLGNKMILLYKDEALRTQLIEAGKNEVKYYSKDKALQALAAILPDGIH